MKLNDERNKSSEEELDDILDALSSGGVHDSSEKNSGGSLLPPRSRSFDDIINGKTAPSQGERQNAAKKPELSLPTNDDTVIIEPSRKPASKPNVNITGGEIKSAAQSAPKNGFSHPLINGGEIQPDIAESIKQSEESGKRLVTGNSAPRPQTARPTARQNVGAPKAEAPSDAKPQIPSARTPRPETSKPVVPMSRPNTGIKHEPAVPEPADTGDDLVVCSDADEKPRFSDSAFFGVFKMAVYVAFVLIVSLSMSYMIIVAGNDIFALKKGDLKEAKVSIPAGLSATEIAEILKDDGIINSKLTFEYYSEFKDFKKKKSAEDKEKKTVTVEASESTFTTLVNKVFSYAFGFLDYLKQDTEFVYNPGDYFLDNSMSYDAIISEITEIKKDRHIIKITIPEGFTTDEIIALFAENGLEATKEEYIDAINNYDYDYEFVKQLTDAGYSKERTYRLDGYLFPDTYEFYNDESAVSIIDKMLSNFNNKFDTSYFDRAAKLGYTVDEIVNLAAIIEKEAKLPAEQLIISSVFHNRLSTGNPDKLESCATVQYAYQTAYGERKSRILDADTRIDHPYNTYIHRGLPPGPICNPGLNAIIAALYPEDTNYKYFVAKADGSSLFAETYEEHLANKELAESGFTDGN